MSIKQAIKNFLYSKKSPDFLSDWYFNRKDAKDRAKLLKLLEAKADLMQAVREDQRPHWQERIQRVVESDDNQYIPRHKAAGTLQNRQLIMHNGIKVDPLSYYSFPLLKMLIDNKGVHEPQEERIFQEALKTFDGSRQLNMLEMGAYWSF